MSKVMTITVTAEWDPEAAVWVATSDDLPGLVTEAATQEELWRKLTVMIPELLEESGVAVTDLEAEVTVRSERVTRIPLRAA